MDRDFSQTSFERAFSEIGRQLDEWVRDELAQHRSPHDLMSIGEAEGKFKVSRRTLTRRIEDGKLSNFGSQFRPLIRESQLIGMYSLRKLGN